MRAEDRAHLRAIVESTDPEVRPADRIRAIELLRGEPDERNVEAELRWELAGLSDAEVDREYDVMSAGEVRGLMAGDEATARRYPVAAAAVAEGLKAELTRGAVPGLLAQVERLEGELEEARSRAAYAATGTEVEGAPAVASDGTESAAQPCFTDAELYPPPVFPDERTPGRKRRR